MGQEMAAMSQTSMGLLEQEAELIEIVRLVGAESISAKDRMVLETTKTIREDFLHQNAFHKTDTHTSITKQYLMLKAILHFHNAGLAAIKRGVDTSGIFKLSVREDIARSSFLEEKDNDKIIAMRDKIDEQIKAL
jgi:V/A-type H+-transporting ATPase subunit A